MKTREEVERLKVSWLKDPCYDLVSPHGCPDGFEEYEVELSAFQAEHQARWKKEAEERKNRINRVGGSFALDMTVREEFAKAIAAGLAARADWPFDDIAASAVKIADDLLDRLSRE